MSRFLTTRVVPLLLAAASCSVHAQTASEDRDVAAFSRLSVHDGIDVYLTQSGRERLRVEVEGYELEDVVTEVDGDVLRLSRSGSRPPGFFGGIFGGLFEDHRITVYLDFVELSAIEAFSGSDIHGRNEMRVEQLTVDAAAGSDVDLAVHATRLQFNVSSGSDLNIRGSTGSFELHASSGSDVSAASLQAERARLTLASGSDAKVQATGSIEIDAASGSDVEVHGNPRDRTVSNDRSSDVRWL